METVTDFIFGGSKITAHDDCSHEIKRCLLHGRKAMTSLDNILKNRDITLPTKVRLVKVMVFPVVMYGCESCGLLRKLSVKELMLLNCGVGEDSWESLGLQGDQTTQSWRKSTLNIHWKNNAEAETPIPWPLGAKSWLIWKDPDVGKDWRHEEKGTTEDEMVGWHHQLGHKFEQALAVGDGQGSLARCSPRGHKESDTTERLKWNEWHSENEKYLIKSRKHSSSRDGVLYHSWNSGMPKADQSQRSNTTHYGDRWRQAVLP